jgi:hypothetical protein
MDMKNFNAGVVIYRFELTTEEVAVKRGSSQGVDVGHINNRSVLGSE